jgi:alpha-glucosidase
MWWQQAVLYRIYPRSFQDSDGDGIGDLRGIVRRMPHLVALGADAIWLSPALDAPAEDVAVLAAAARAHNVRLIQDDEPDLAPNDSLIEMPWNARAVDALIHDTETALASGGWPIWVLGSHEHLRVASRIGREQARIAAMLLLTLRGTPAIYYGDEIGMSQVAIPSGGAHTPMQWDATRNAGFSDAEPWLPLAEDHRSRNVNNQTVDKASMFQLYRRLTALRRRYIALRAGRYRRVPAQGDMLMYLRQAERERFLIALNLSERPCEVAFPGLDIRGIIRVSCFGDRDGQEVKSAVPLRGDEGLVIELAPGSAAPPTES